jgi:hypothetical protein
MVIAVSYSSYCGTSFLYSLLIEVHIGCYHPWWHNGFHFAINFNLCLPRLCFGTRNRRLSAATNSCDAISHCNFFSYEIIHMQTYFLADYRPVDENNSMENLFAEFRYSLGSISSHFSFVCYRNCSRISSSIVVWANLNYDSDINET